MSMNLVRLLVSVLLGGVLFGCVTCDMSVDVGSEHVALVVGRTEVTDGYPCAA